MAELFAGVADLASGSRMAVIFDSGFQNQRLFSRHTRAYDRRRRAMALPPSLRGSTSFLAQSGWTINTS